MSNGRIRKKSAREALTQSSPYHRSNLRRQSYDDSSIVYRSTPEYLRQLLNTSTMSNGSTNKSLVRPSSASEITPRNLGNPKYKAQEDYYDEVQLLKKELKYFKDDNSNLRARLRRLEEDNVRKNKQIEGLYDNTKDVDSRRTSATNSVLMNMKQRLFKLEVQLKQKETIIDAMKNDPRWTKATELEIQNRALFNEIEKQKFERLQTVQQNYLATVDEEKTKAVRKLEGEKQELKIENDNLRKKLADRDEQSSTRRREDSDERELRRKIDHFKDVCRKQENEIDVLKDELKDVRRERDKFHDKFDHMREDLQEIKRERDQYREKLERTNGFDDRSYPAGRASPSLKRNDEYFNKRPLSRSPEDWSRKDSKSMTPVRSSLMSTKSSHNLRQKNWTSDDDYRVERFRRKHAATVIQRGWRHHHHRSRQHGFEHSEKRNGMTSPRGSRQKLGSKIDQFGSGSIKNRPTPSMMSNESALKILQAVSRGHIQRTELDKNPRLLKSQRNAIDDNDDRSPTFGRRYEKNEIRENFLKQSKSSFTGLRNDNMGSTHRDSSSRLRRTPSPPSEHYRSFSPGSKTNFFNDQHKSGSGYRSFGNERESPHRASSPTRDTYRSVSPYYTSSSKQSLPNDKNKSGSSPRLERDSALRKPTLSSKQSLKTIPHDDDEDILGF